MTFPPIKIAPSAIFTHPDISGFGGYLLSQTVRIFFIELLILNLEYSNNPTTNSTHKTPDKEVYVIDVDINVNKVANSNSGDALKDAEFKVFKGATQPADTAEAWYKWDATNKKVTWVAKANADTFKTGADGKFTPAVQGLEAEKTGTAYGLLETVAPKGYNLLKDPVIVTLTGAYAEGTSGKTATVTASGADVTNGALVVSVLQSSM